MSPPAVASIKDAEIGDKAPVSTVSSKKKSFFTLKNLLLILGGVFLFASMLALMFGMGVLASHYVDDDSKSNDAVTFIASLESGVVGDLVRREDCNETAISVASGARAATAVLPSSHAVVPIPISTQTDLRTIYSTPVYTPEPEVLTKYHTTTDITYITVLGQLPSPSSEETCQVDVVTETVTVTVLPTAECAPANDATVTGNPATVTAVQTDVSYTSGLPDATVSGNPKTITEALTDISITSGLPDATISGNPGTVTDVDVSYSLTASQEYGTIVIVETAHKTLTTTMIPGATPGVTLTISDLWPVVASSAADGVVATSQAYFSTKTEWTTKTTGSTSVSIVSVTVGSPPYPSSNTTESSYASGTATYGPIPTTPVIISGASKEAAGAAMAVLLVAAVCLL